MLVNDISESLRRLELGVSVENAQALKKDLDFFANKLKDNELLLKKYMTQTVETQSILKCSLEGKKHIVNSLSRFCDDVLEGKKEHALQEWQSLESAVSSGNRELKQLWSEYKQQTYVASANLISALFHVLDEDDKLSLLGVLRKEIESSSIGNTQMVKDIQRFREITEGLIESRKMEPDVQEFVKKLASGEEIFLSEITDETYEWLRNNRLDKKVKLSISTLSIH